MSDELREWMKSVGFTKVKADGDVIAYRIGPEHAALFLVQGYRTGDWWAMLCKYPVSLEHSAGRFPHFDKRLKTRSDVRRLCAALGIELKEKASA